MALVECKECGAKVSKKAVACPECGEPEDKSVSRLWVLVFIVGIFIYAAMDDGSGGASGAAAGDKFRQQGSFKDDGRNRVFTVQMLSAASSNEAFAYARRKPYSKGSLTAVYFYDAGALMPVDGVTKARNYGEVNRVLYEMDGLSGWRFAYMRGLNGSEILADCSAEPGAELCK